MTRRPVQQARRITDRQQFLGDWPERQSFTWDPIRSKPVDIIGLAVGTVVFSLVLVALALGLFLMATAMPR